VFNPKTLVARIEILSMVKVTTRIQVNSSPYVTEPPLLERSLTKRQNRGQKVPGCTTKHPEYEGKLEQKTGISREYEDSPKGFDVRCCSLSHCWKTREISGNRSLLEATMDFWRKSGIVWAIPTSSWEVLVFTDIFLHACWKHWEMPGKPWRFRERYVFPEHTRT